MLDKNGQKMYLCQIMSRHKKVTDVFRTDKRTSYSKSVATKTVSGSFGY